MRTDTFFPGDGVGRCVGKPGGSRYPAQVTATRTAPAGLVGQLARFVAVGALSALVDLGVYQFLLHLGVWVHAAKAISFILGTTTAYLLNRRFTFTAAWGGSGGSPGSSRCTRPRSRSTSG